MVKTATGAQVENVDEVGRHLGQPFEHAAHARGGAQLQLVNHERGKIDQGGDFLLGQMARLGIDDAERTDEKTVGGAQWRSSVETNVGCAGNRRIVGEARVFERVWND